MYTVEVPLYACARTNFLQENSAHMFNSSYSRSQCPCVDFEMSSQRSAGRCDMGEFREADEKCWLQRA